MQRGPIWPGIGSTVNTANAVAAAPDGRDGGRRRQVSAGIAALSCAYAEAYQNLSTPAVGFHAQLRAASEGRCGCVRKRGGR
ncbi:PE family protein [Mycobacterium attenuatum]|uniref:PE family protein n=1 Tax=Mycobacterium attenuatum TaxID=2341086 RepID=UPI00313E8D86